MRGSMPTDTAAIIANPMAGQDLRRLVAYGATSDNLGKVRALQRVLIGLREAGVRSVLYMPDGPGLVPAAWDGLSPEEQADLTLVPLLAAITGEPTDTVAAARALAGSAAGCLVVLGGDGTNRLVAPHLPDLPLLPLSTGTNNAFPLHLEPTLAGLAAGLVATGRADPARVCRREKALRVTAGGATELALVDVAFLPDAVIGARAIWQVQAVRQLVCTQGEPMALGLSALAARACPVGRAEPGGAYLELGDGPPVRAPIAPGLFAGVGLRLARRLAPGASVALGPGPGVLALDGERLLTLEAGEQAQATLVSGPLLVLPERALAQRFLRRTEGFGPSGVEGENG